MSRSFRVRERLLSLFLASTAAVGAGCAGTSDPLQGVTIPTAAEQYDVEALRPEVMQFARDTYFLHKAEFPDVSEPVEALAVHVQVTDLIERGQVEDALKAAAAAVARFPEARHAQEALGRAAWRKYQLSRSESDLRQASDALTLAYALGLRNGRVRYIDQLAEVLGTARNTERLAQVFEPLLAAQPGNWAAAFDYARGLSRAGSSAAESWYQRSVALRPAGQIDPVVEYGKWLIERSRFADALRVLGEEQDQGFPVVQLYRGAAAERLGQIDEARAAYQQAAEFTDIFPAPGAYRTEAAVGAGVFFDDDRGAETHCAGHNKLSEIMYCEARGEGTGGQRAVGWTLRTRVFRGTEQTGCYVNNSGSTICAQYNSVGSQSGQFYQCGTRSSTSDSIAYDVFYGRVPDPYTGYCPAGTHGTGLCTTTCSSTSSSGASGNGPEFFYATSSSCATRHPSGCGSTPAKTCSNGGSDHCFYRVP
jgi:tetratricopeptide (TPR) repeat protein